MRQYLITLASLVLLTGCASQYQQFERGFFTTENGGYTDKQQSENEFIVSYIGDKNDSSDLMELVANSHDKIRKRAYRRAGEVTLEHKFKYFLVTLEVKGFAPGGGTAISLTTITLHIKCFKDNPPEGALDAYDPSLYRE